MSNTAEFDRILKSTLDDGRVSRAERSAMKEVLEQWGTSPAMMAQLRARAFAIAAERAEGSREVILWLEDVVKVLTIAPREVAAEEVYFSPGEACRNKIIGLLAGARRTVDICVFTVTDNEITDAIAAAHRRGVKLRIVTDDQKSHDRGSDVSELGRAGIPIATDQSEKHMHHKFAVFDGTTVLTGSYNWTRSAASQNEENIVVSREPGLCRAFSEEFESLWNQYR